MQDQEYDELVLLRTHLTVALLAVSQLQRKHRESPQAARLCAYALDALHQMRDEIAQIDRLIGALDSRRALRDDPVRLRLARRQEIDEAHDGQ